MCGSSLNWYVPVLYAIRVLQSRHRMEYGRNAVGSLAQIRALTRDGTLDKVNGNLVPRTHCLVLEAVSNIKDTPKVLISLLFLTLLLNYANSNVTPFFQNQCSVWYTTYLSESKHSMCNNFQSKCSNL